MDYFKKIERSITISADKRSTVDLQVDVWSQDLNITKFILKLDTTDSTTIDLTNATVRVAMVYNQDGQDVKIEAAGIVEDVATQKIAYIMDDKLAGFEGTVTAGFYVTLNTGQRIDIQNVTFNMRKSLLDKDLEAATDSYYQTFDDIVADVQSTGNKAKADINAVLPSVQSQVSELDRQIKALPQIPDLFVAYANSADGSVDFSRAKPKENLWEQSKTVDGWFEDDGTLTNAYSATQHKIYPEYIRVNPNDIYYLTFINPNSVVNKINSNKIIFLDENKRIVDKIWVMLNEKIVRQIKIPVPSNARYMRVGIVQGVDSYDSSIKIKLEKSDTPTIYLPSKYDNYRDSFMKYIGYGIKNSTNPAEYKWQVNPEWQRAQLEYEKVSAIKSNLINLCVNGDFSQNKNGWSIVEGIEYENGHYVKKNPGSYYFQDIPLTNKHIVYVKGTNGVDTNDLGIVSKINLFIIGTYTFLKSVNNTSTVSTSSTLLEINNGGIRIDLSKEGLDENNSVGVWLDDILVYDLTAIFGDGNEPTLEEFERLLAINVNSPTIYSQSIAQSRLTSHPINSLYYTESAESPETTFGGKWSKLGTEAKFSKTFNVWQRTQ